MFFLLALLALIGYIVYVIFKKQSDVYNEYSELSWIELVIKIVYRVCAKPRQGVLHLDKSLVYLAGGSGVSSDCSLAISPTNHKLTIKKFRIDHDNLSQYKSLCGYNELGVDVPVCYGETVFLKALIAVITSTKFCLSPLGLIHLRQTITQHAPLRNYLNNDLTLEVAVVEYRQTNRGVEVDISLRIITNTSNCIWDGQMTLLSRGKMTGRQTIREKKEGDDGYEISTDFHVPGNCGVEFAKLTGDWNPHHLYRWSAMLLGFRGPIAHGMWTLSRALAELQSRGYEVYKRDMQISCDFKRPLFMPGHAKVRCDEPAAVYTDGWKIKVEEHDSGIPHLIAKLKFT